MIENSIFIVGRQRISFNASCGAIITGGKQTRILRARRFNDFIKLPACKRLADSLIDQYKISPNGVGNFYRDMYCTIFEGDLILKTPYVSGPLSVQRFSRMGELAIIEDIEHLVKLAETPQDAIDIAVMINEFKHVERNWNLKFRSDMNNFLKG